MIISKKLLLQKISKIYRHDVILGNPPTSPSEKSVFHDFQDDHRAQNEKQIQNNKVLFENLS